MKHTFNMGQWAALEYARYQQDIEPNKYIEQAKAKAQYTLGCAAVTLMNALDGINSCKAFCGHMMKEAGVLESAVTDTDIEILIRTAGKLEGIIADIEDSTGIKAVHDFSELPF